MYKIISSLVVFILIILPSGLFAQDGSAMFDGLDSRFYITDYIDPLNTEANRDIFKIDGTTITLEAWIYILGLPHAGENKVILSRNFYENSEIFSSYELRLINTMPDTIPQIEFYLAGIGNVDGSVVSPAAVEKERWIHIAGTYDGSSMKLYLNDTEVNSTPFTATINPWTDVYYAAFYIGAHFTQKDFFYGFIDDVRLWGDTRTVTEIADNLNNNLNGNEDGLLGYWPLRAEDSDFAIDLTANHNDLTGRSPILNDFDHTSSATSAILTVKDEIVDFGVCEKDVARYSHVSLINSGDKPCYGKLSSSTSDVTFQADYFVLPGDTNMVLVQVTPHEYGELYGNILFNVGNADNLPLSVPFQIESINLDGFDGNNIGMWMINNGQFAYNPVNGQSGLYWPLDEKKNAVYASGMWIGAMVNGEKRTTVCYHRSEFRPGPIIDGAASDPSDDKYRLYKINKGDDSSNPDYAEWPSDLGAPVNADGSPAIIGDQTLFMVYNDLDPTAHLSNYGLVPLGVEVQQTVFGFNDEGPLSNTVFLRFKILNKSNDVWNDVFCSLWSDPDLGDAYNDLIGIDTIRTLGFCYNGYPTDDVYGSEIPAVGYDILKGAFYTKPIQAFAYYTNGMNFPLGDPNSVEETYNFMSGKLADGTNYTDPTNNKNTLFALNGDPVTNSGWIDSNPDDRRFLFSTGPFSLEPNQSKEIIAAIIVARGDDYIDSITKLRAASDAIQTLYDNGEIFGGALESVVIQDIEPNQTGTVDDISNSGAEIELTSGESGASIEVASFVEPPAGAEDIEGTAVHGVGNYVDLQVEGDIEYPVTINMYYTQNDLNQSGVVEDDLLGLYYWSGSQNEWILYSESGDDDQQRGISTTGVNTDNLVIGGTNYEGMVWASVYHLTQIRIGTKIDSALMSIENNLKKQYSFKLNQNYPNPFNPITTISYELKVNSYVQIEIYDLLGREILSLVKQRQNAGSHSITFNASSLSSGLYIYKLKAGNFEQNRKMLLLR